MKVCSASKAYINQYSKYNLLENILITDLSGHIVYQRQYRLNAGKDKLELILPTSVKDGMYIISNGSSAQKFLLKRKRDRSY